MNPVLTTLARRSVGVLVATTAVAASLVVTAAAAHADAASASTTAAPAGRYYSITPTRVLDTRTVSRPLLHGETRTVDLSKAFTARASAVVLNLTVVTPTGAGFLTAFPTGIAKPNASSLNFRAGQIRANSVTVAVGNNDDISVYGYIGGTGGLAGVVVDVLGYYGAGGSSDPGLSYQPLDSPTRIFDTRSSIGALTDTFPQNTGIVQIDYGSPAVNKTIKAVAMNLTVTGTAAAGYLTVWTGLGAPPLASALNWAPGETVANFAVIPVICSNAACTTLTFSIRNAVSPATQVIGDIAGAYFTPSAQGLLYQPTSPTRVTDTRVPMAYGTLGTRAAGTTNMSSWVDPAARAVNLNVTAVSPTNATYLTLYPAGSTLPAVSTVNAAAGDVIANAAQVRMSRGQFVTANFLGNTDVVIDVAGTFVVDATPTAGAAKAAPAAAAPARVGGAVVVG